MIKLKPDPDNNFICPQCHAVEPHVNEFKFETINILADCTCVNCGFEFFQVLPSGHCVDYLISINKRDGTIFQKANAPDWLSDSLLAAHLGEMQTEVPIEKIVYKNSKKVIILNALDTLYGHVLLKLFNAFHHLDYQSDFGLILIVPKIFKWLIPSGCAEAWIVDIKLDDLKYSYSSFQRFISIEFARFQEIYLSNAYSHPSLGKTDIERLTGTAPFDTSKFLQQKPVVTFILREDRWWFESRFDFWFYRIFRKMKLLSWAKRILSLRQNKLIKETTRAIKKQIPEINFFVVGLGKTGGFDSKVTDNRKKTVDSSMEKEWCEVYAQSQVVIGIHGSNMLLPTALAAGCVEILPEDRYGNLIQDIAVRYSDRRQLFFYRFADQYASPQSVANKAVAILHDYKVFNRNMCINQYSDVPSMISLQQVHDSNH